MQHGLKGADQDYAQTREMLGRVLRGYEPFVREVIAQWKQRQ